MRMVGFTKQPIAAAMSCVKASTQTGLLQCRAQATDTFLYERLNRLRLAFPLACRFVSYCMGRVEIMRSAGVTPVIVFDGGRLPMKAGEEESRARSVEHVLLSRHVLLLFA